VLQLLPLPYVYRSERQDGLEHPWPSRCRSCLSRECERDGRLGEVGLCSYGYNFKRLSSDLLVAGFVLENFARDSQARAKNLKRARHERLLVKRATLDQVELRTTGAAEAERAAIEARREQIVQDFIKKELYKGGVLDALRPELRRAFSYLHDYKQFISQVTQNINVILEQRYGGTLEEQLAAATRAEGAIYWAAKLMEEKLKSASFLIEPEKIEDPASFTTFQFYKMVDKYARIYRSSFEAKNVRLVMQGRSYESVRGNGEAVAVIPHTFIDNALKYAPPHSDVVIQIAEVGDEIRLDVMSYGPRIHPDEFERIFELFYRGRDARTQHDEGMGFGLYLARFIARKMGTDIGVSQDQARRSAGCYWTTFGVRFRRA
jgi:signal transduction histidine kinase